MKIKSMLLGGTAMSALSLIVLPTTVAPVSGMMIAQAQTEQEERRGPGGRQQQQQQQQQRGQPQPRQQPGQQQTQPGQQQQIQRGRQQTQPDQQQMRGGQQQTQPDQQQQRRRGQQQTQPEQQQMRRDQQQTQPRGRQQQTRPGQQQTQPGRELQPAQTPPTGPQPALDQQRRGPGTPQTQPSQQQTTPAQQQLQPRQQTLPGQQPQAPTGRMQPSTMPPAQVTSPQTTSRPGGEARRLDDFRSQRREVRQGNSTVIQEPGRTIIRDGNRLVIQRNDSDRFGRGARDVRTERRGNENFTIIERPGGVRIINVTDVNGRVLRRVRRDPSGREVVLFDNVRRGSIAGAVAVGAAAAVAGVVILNLAQPSVRIPREQYIVEYDRADRALVYDTLMAPPVDVIDRDYTLDEIRYNVALRDRMRRIDIDTLTFDTGSWEITPDQAQRLQGIAEAILQAIKQNPDEMFLIEGYTDAVGNDVDNLSLSDRRAESVAQVLTEQFNVPPENMTTQGYGEQHLKVPTDGPERQNRRVTARRITPLLNGPVAQRR